MHQGDPNSPTRLEILGLSGVSGPGGGKAPRPSFRSRNMKNKDPGDLRTTWQVRQDAIRLREQYGMTVSDIAQVLSCDRRMVKYWLGIYPSETRQGDVY